MTTETIRRSDSSARRARVLEARWQKLCDSYLPRAPQDSIWRYSDRKPGAQLHSGWKLHISATILNAATILKRVAPLLIARGVSFKAPRSLVEVAKLNSGLDYNYSQIGKIITVYPRNDTEAVFLATRLHRLTIDFAAPAVPFDLRFKDSSNVYYRFGAFDTSELVRKGRRVPAVRAPNGRLMPDVRVRAKPDGVFDPFEAHLPKSQPADRESISGVRVLRVLAQRGKGGVYAAVNLNSAIPQFCLLKEGRKDGEVTWDGRDGASRIRNERRALTQLSVRGVPVPKTFASFKLGGNYYLLMEYLDGETLHEKLLRRRRRLALKLVIDYGGQLAKFMSQIHGVGWAWRDCKPKNLIVTREGRLVPLDFESASPIYQQDESRWRTPGFALPSGKLRTANGVTEDLYALGSMLYFLLTGRVFDNAQPVRIHRLRRHVPPSLRHLVELMLATDFRGKCSSAAAVHANLISISLNSRHRPWR